MKTNTILSFIVLTVIALFAVSSIIAASDLPVSIKEVTVNGIDVTGATLSGVPGETVPIVVMFTAKATLEDVKLRLWIEGYKSDIVASTQRFDVVAGSTYIKRLSLTLPSVQDMDNNPESLTLYVKVADTNDYMQEEYTISMEKESYSLDVLNVDAPSRASAGDIVPFDVVIKNIGGRNADDTFVTISIPELGLSKKAYMGDLYSQETAQDDTDNEDARERIIYLAIPSDVQSGDYTVQISASNYDAIGTARKVISITGTAVNNSTNNTTVIKPTTNDDKAGMPTSVIVLTVVLVIIFVVLLVVLIVLLTKKPSDKTEDFGETSYY
jgi:hypothetical protein